MQRIVAMLAVVLGLAAPSRGDTLLVDAGGGERFSDIQSAIDEARDGDTVLVRAGEYVVNESIDFNRLHDPVDPSTPPVKDIVVRSESGPEATTIRMSDPGGGDHGTSVVVFEKGETPASVLEGFTITGGGGSGRAGSYHRVGGGLLVAGASPTVRGCRIEGNAADMGGGAYCGSSARPTFVGCRFSRNEALSNGGGLACGVEGVPSLVGCWLLRNSARSWGGGAWVESGGALSCSNCTISGNRASSGGGLEAYDADVRLVGCTVSGNAARFSAGISTNSGSLTSCILWDNAGGRGGLRENVTVERSCVPADSQVEGPGNTREDPRFCGWVGPAETLVGSPSELGPLWEGFRYSLAPGSPCIGTGKDGANMGADHGLCDEPPVPEPTLVLAAGTFPADGIPTILRASIRGAGAGETIIEGTLRGLRTGASVSDLTITGGTSGGIEIDFGESPEVRDVIVSGNRAESASVAAYVQGAGGGVRVRPLASPTFLRCAIQGNLGGGVACEAPSWSAFTGCTIRANAGQAFGGIRVDAAATAVLVDCLVAENVGCGIVSNGSVSMLRCTVADNVAVHGIGGLRVDSPFPGSETTATGCILWDNVGGSWRPGDPVELSFSCVEGEETPAGEGNIGADPEFCGWSPLAAEVAVRRQEDLDRLRGAFRYSLSAGSPCRGRGVAGEDMGAPFPACDGAPRAAITVRVEPGRFSVEDFVLANHVSIVGTRADDCVLEGTLLGLRSGCALADVTVTGGPRYGVVPAYGESAAIRRCTVTENSWGGIVALGPHRIEDCTVSSNENFGVRAGGGAELVRCRLVGNRRGVSCAEGRVSIRECALSGDPGRESDVGVSCDPGTSVTLTRCAISGSRVAGVRCEEDSEAVASGCILRDNLGTGLLLDPGASAELRSCTVSGNAEAGIRGSGPAIPSARLSITSTIVWDNLVGSIAPTAWTHLDIAWSCVEGDTVWPGEGNVLADPRFCGWGAATEVGVGDPGELKTLLAAFSYALSASSPCAGTGEGGGDMGSEGVSCPPDEVTSLAIRLGPGDFDLGDSSLTHGVSIVGAGRDETVLRGTVRGLRTGSVLSGVTITGGGGLIVADGDAPVIADVAVSGNWDAGLQCGRGAAPLVLRSTMTRNREGGVRCSGPATFVGCEISENAGTGVVCYGDATFSACRIWGNRGWLSGGLHLEGTGAPRVTGCLIFGNRASIGGGILVGPEAEPSIRSSAIFGNASDDEGGAVSCFSPHATILGCTIAENSGVGLSSCTRTAAFPRVESCVIWGNPGGSIGGCSSVDLRNCCVEGGAPDPRAGNIAADPQLVRRGSFDFSRFAVVDVAGGEHHAPDFVVEAPDYRLRPGSPCVDSGSAAAGSADLDGNRRPCGAGFDMGAYERGDCRPGPRFLRGDSNADGARDIADAAFSLAWLFLGGPGPPCRDAADSDDDSEVRLTDPVFLLNWLFLSGAAPPEPIEACGTDPTPDSLGCGAFPPCG